MTRTLSRIFAAILLLAAALPAALLAQQRYALILEDSPVSERFTSRAQLQSNAAGTYRQQIAARQEALRSELGSRNIQITGSASTLLNAVFVSAPPERLDELKGLPGVKGVVPERRYQANLNRAVQLVNGFAALNSVGGPQNGGRGIKIAILDNGIDQTHPAFQDSSLSVPAGFPICKIAYPGGVA